MALATYEVSADADDYDDQTPGLGIYLNEAIYNRVVIPFINGGAHHKVDTTAFPSGVTITQLDFGCAYNSYNATRGTSKIYTLTIRDTIGVQKASKANITFPGGYVGLPAIAWVNNLSSTFFPWVNAGGKTWMTLSVPDPGGGKSRQMVMGTKELSDLIGGDARAKLRVTYSDAAGKTHVMIVGA